MAHTGIHGWLWESWPTATPCQAEDALRGRLMRRLCGWLLFPERIVMRSTRFYSRSFYGRGLKVTACHCVCVACWRGDPSRQPSVVMVQWRSSGEWKVFVGKSSLVSKGPVELVYVWHHEWCSPACFLATHGTSLRTRKHESPKFK